MKLKNTRTNFYRLIERGSSYKTENEDDIPRIKRW